MIRFTSLAIVLAAALGGGCGTIANLKRPTIAPPESPGAEVCRAYGAVRTDVAAARDYNWREPVSYADYVTLPILMLVNFALDVVGDTVTLPYTLVSELRRALDRPDERPASGYPAGTTKGPVLGAPETPGSQPGFGDR